MSPEEPNHRKNSKSEALLTFLVSYVVIFGLMYSLCRYKRLAMVLNEILIHCHLTAALVTVLWIGGLIRPRLAARTLPTWTEIWRGLRSLSVPTAFFGLMFGISWVPSSKVSPVLVTLAMALSVCGLLVDWLIWLRYLHNRLRHRVRLLIDDRQYAEALQILRPQLARPSVEDLLMAGQAYLCLGDFEEGHRVLSLALTNGRRSTRILDEVARLYYRCGYYEAALPLYNEVLAAGEQSIIASINQCCCVLAMRHLGDADEIWQTIKTHPEFPSSQRDPTIQSMLEFIRTALE